MLTIQHSSYLLQGKGILLNGQRTMNGSDAVSTAQGWICGKERRCSQTAHQFCDLCYTVDDLVCDFKGRLFDFHANSSQMSMFDFILPHIAHFINQNSVYFGKN